MHATAADAHGSAADWSADAQVSLGAAREAAGDEAGAVRHYARAMSLIQGYGPARQRLAALAAVVYEAGSLLARDGNGDGAVPFLVRAVEYDPTHAAARAELAALLAARNRRDITKQCFVYHDPGRGAAVYREAFLRAWEFVGSSGIVGDYLEFGVLAGFTARINAETVRDLMLWPDLHLFDSFDGLPEYTSPVDANSYDIAGRNVWADKMRFPDWYVEQLGEPIHKHVARAVCEVISPHRVHVHRGFFSETLKEPLGRKAAVVHVDCDLYQSTVEVFTRLYETGVFQDGCVLMFDDYNCFKANPNYGERRAFREFLEGQSRFTASPWFTYGFNGAAYFLHDTTA